MISSKLIITTVLRNWAVAITWYATFSIPLDFKLQLWFSRSAQMYGGRNENIWKAVSRSELSTFLSDRNCWHDIFSQRLYHLSTCLKFHIRNNIRHWRESMFVKLGLRLHRSGLTSIIPFIAVYLRVPQCNPTATIMNPLNLIYKIDITSA